MKLTNPFCENLLAMENTLAAIYNMFILLSYTPQGESMSLTHTHILCESRVMVIRGEDEIIELILIL